MEIFLPVEIFVLMASALVLVAVIATLVVHWHFNLEVAPAAIRRWAAERRCQVILIKNIGAFESFSDSRILGPHVRRVIYRDAAGDDWECVVRVGHGTRPWPCLSVDHCQVEVDRWKGGPTRLPSKSKEKPSRDWDLE